MTDLALVTIATSNYVPGAAVTCRSFLDHHPGARASIVLIDGVDDLTARIDPRVELLTTADLPVDPPELTDLAMLYEPFELAVALKPLALLAMLDRHPTPVIYLDADIEVFAPLDDVAALAYSAGVALTPHRFEAVPRDGMLPDEETLLQAGTFNSGFVAASTAGRPMLEWWWQLLRRDCAVDPGRQRYLDQRALDHAITLHDIEVVRDPGCNVGYWNVDTRAVLDAGSTGWTAGGVPLRFFHFSGFDPRRPWTLSRHTDGAPRVRLSDAPHLALLCARYADRLLASGWDEAQNLPNDRATLPDGTLIDTRMRRVYRDALERSDSGGGPAPPNPFRAGEVAAFWRLLAQPHPDHPRVSRYLFEAWRQRPDVGATIGSLQRDAADRFADWLLDHGDTELQIPPRLLPERPVAARFRERTSGPQARSPGLVVAGLVGADLGVGQAARLAIEAAVAAGLEPEIVGYDNTMSQQSHRLDCVDAGDAVGDVALVCLNPDVLPNFIDASWPRFQQGRRTVGLWFWEVDVAVPSMERAFDLVDEVWVTTDHVRRALAPIATKPLEVVELPLVSAKQLVPNDPRDRLGIPLDRFTFLFTYDSLSVPERKNPVGLVQAFSMAFSPDEGPVLVVKTINGEGRETTEHLHHLAAARPDIIILDRYLSPDEVLTLTASADCYASLHRAEGWGLTLAEAMAAGTPVIATGHSGNMTFMTPQNSFLVPYDLVSVGPGHAPYPPHAVWAEPDLVAAAAVMRHVCAHPEDARRVAAQARHDISARHTPAATAAGFAAAVERARDRQRTRS